MFLTFYNIRINFHHSMIKSGEVSERLKEHVWNTCIHYLMYQGFESLSHQKKEKKHNFYITYKNFK